MIKLGLELANFAGCGCDFLSLLTTSEDDVVFMGTDGGRVDRSVCFVSLEEFQGEGVEQSGTLVFRGGDQQETPSARLQVVHFLFMLVRHGHPVTAFGVKQSQVAVLVPCHQNLTLRPPQRDSQFRRAFRHWYRLPGLVFHNLVSISGVVQKYFVLPVLSDVSSKKELFRRIGKPHGLHRLATVYLMQHFARFEVPQNGTVVSGTGQQLFGIEGRVHRPDDTVVSVVGSETFAVSRKPNIARLVLSSCEQQIAFGVVFDLSERSSVTLQQNRSHQTNLK